MSLGVAYLTSTSSLLAQCCDNSFGWDLSETGDLSPVSVCSTDVGLDGVGGDYYDENGTLVGTSGALEFSVTNLPPGTYDITIAGDGPYSHGEHLTLTSGSNTTTSDLYHDGTTIYDFVVTEGEPLHVRVEGMYAFAYVSGISFYGPKCPPPPCYDNSSFGFDLTEAAAPSAPVYLCDSTEVDLPMGGDQEYADDGTWKSSGGALYFSVDNLPPGTYDITITGDGYGSGGQYLTVSSDGNSATSDLYHDSTTITDFVVTEGEPLNVTVMAAYAIAYASGISFYGPKSP